MLQKYERKAEDILEKLSKEEPNERNFQMLANAYIIMAGSKAIDMMGGGTERYDGRRRDSMGRFRYDGMDDRHDKRYMYDREDAYWDDDEDGEDEYYDGRGVSRRDGRRKGARKNISGGIK